MEELILRDIAKDINLKGDDALNYIYSYEVKKGLDLDLLKRARGFKTSLRRV